MDFFRVRRVEIEGARYAAPDEIVSRLRVDTTASVWDDVSPLEARVREHPQVREVRIRRKLPGTLVVVVTENPPVALVSGAGRPRGDGRGGRLAAGGSHDDGRGPAGARVAGHAAAPAARGDAAEDPALFARVSEARRTPRGDIVLVLPEHRVLASADVTVRRLGDVLPVELDLARRSLAVAELDLRFRDQVIARLPGK
jgi:cell division protein FtsQ